MSGCCCTVVNGQPPITITIDQQGALLVTQTPGVGPVGPVGATGPTGPQGDSITGPTGWTGPVGAGGSLGHYGSFYHTFTQTTSVNTDTPMLLNTTAESSGVSVVSGSRITFTYGGTFDVQFSAQVHNTGGGGNGETVDIWLSRNGTAVTETATRLTVQNGRYLVPAWDFLLTVSAGDYVELVWRTDNDHIVLEHVNASGTVPAVPSLIVTVMQVMYTQVGPTGPTGPQGLSITGPTGWTGLGWTGPTGPQGDDAIEIGPTPPLDLNVLWLDTSDPATACLSSVVESDWVNPYSYMGVAVAGSATSANVWRITRINVGPPVSVGVAEPVAWDDRYTVVYT